MSLPVQKGRVKVEHLLLSRGLRGDHSIRVVMLFVVFPFLTESRRGSEKSFSRDLA